MLIYKSTNVNKKSIYKCDRCKKQLEDEKDRIYTLYVRKIIKKPPKRKWDLCERCYIAFYKAIEKGTKKKVEE